MAEKGVNEVEKDMLNGFSIQVKANTTNEGNTGRRNALLRANPINCDQGCQIA